MTSIQNLAAKLAALLALLSVTGGCGSAAPTPVPDDLVIVAPCGDQIRDCAINVGSEQAFSALVVYGDGSRQPESAAWKSDDPAVASVDGDGRVRGIKSGSTSIRARVRSLTAIQVVRVRPKYVGGGPWKGEFAIRRCTASGSFDPDSWCPAFYRVGDRWLFELHATDESGRLGGGIVIDRSGSGLTIDEGATLDADGRLHLSARRADGMLGPFLELIDPLRAQIRGTSLEGSFVMTITDERGSAFPGSVVVEADLVGVTLE